MTVKVKEDSWQYQPGSYQVSTLCHEDVKAHSWGDEEQEYNYSAASYISGRKYFYLNLIKSYACASKIEYDDGPKYRDGIPNWKTCTHSRYGFTPERWGAKNPFKFTVAGLYSSSAGGKTDSVQYYPDRRFYDSGTSGEVDIDLPLLDAYGGSLLLSSWDTDFDVAGPASLAEVENTTMDALIGTFYEDKRDELEAWRRSAMREFKSQADLNKLLHVESNFYANMAQIVFPMGKLLGSRKAVQKFAKMLSTLRSRFGKRPLREALSLAIKADFIDRFVVETTLMDAQDFMGSFAEVLRIYESAASANARAWTRLFYRPPAFNATSVDRSYSIRVGLPRKETLPSTGIPGTYWNGRVRQKWGPNPDDWVWHYFINSGRTLGNQEYYGYTPLEAVHQLLERAIFEGFGGTYNAQVSWSKGAYCHLDLMRWAKVRYKDVSALSPLKVWANRVGITKPLTSLWDLKKLSFVCDYFFRIGDWIEGVSNYAADFQELRGEIIDAQEPWVGSKWEVGCLQRLTNYDQKKAENVLKEHFKLNQFKVPSTSFFMPFSSRYSREPMPRWENSSRFGLVSERALNSTQKRTLAELAFSSMDRKLRIAEETSEQTKAALVQLKLESKRWRTPNAAIAGMSNDQFSDYVKRTLKQVATTVKVKKARTRK